MIKFSILGSTKLQREDGSYDHSFLTGPKRLALLTYLTLARPRGYQRRDKLIALFWPETGQKSARNALSNMLYHIREALGEDAVTNRGMEEISINREKISCDATAFEKALDEDEVGKALDFYRGDLLPAFHLPAVSNEFMSWLDGERERLRKRAAEAAWMLAEQAEQNQNSASARQWAKKAVSYSEFSEETYHRLITLLHRLGDRPGALKAYDEFTTLIRKEWEMEPSPKLQALANTIRETSPESRSGSDTDHPEKQAARSVAVLPFETIGTQTSRAFAGGIHGDVLTNLSKVSDIKVISRTSARQYAETTKTIKEIGRELNATWILEGDVQESSGRIQINVRLINARDDTQLWSKDYRRKLTADNLFRIQREITGEIVDALEAEFTPEEKNRVQQRPTQSLDAYRLYMQGWSWAEQRTEKGYRRALDYYDRVIEKDPNYTLAKVASAFALIGLNDYGFEEADTVLPQAETLIQEALKQNDELPEAHTALANLYSVRHEGAKTIRELMRAVELRPGYSDAHNRLSWNYQLLGEAQKALTHAKKAVDLDPFSPETVSNLSLSYLTNNRFEGAVNAAQRTRELQPNWTTGPFYEAVTYYHLEKYDEVISLLDQLSVPWAGEGPRITLALARVATGQVSLVRDHLAYFKDIEDHFATGMICAALGENEGALNSFDQIERWEHWPTLSLHHFYPKVLESIKDEPRFKKVVENMKQGRA